MPEYRRMYQPGGTFFFTVVTADRTPFLADASAVRLLRRAIHATGQRWPFTVDALVVLPDHLHTMWTLPDGDVDFSTRWAYLKKTFTKAWLASHGEEQPVSDSKQRARRRGVWQRRFWEHTIRDETDFERHCDYIHYNPVRHGLAACPHTWAFSTFRHYVRRGFYDPQWVCVCNGRCVNPPRFEELATTARE